MSYYINRGGGPEFYTSHVAMSGLMLLHPALLCTCWPLPSNQSLYRQIASYDRDVDDHRDWPMTRGGDGPTRQLQDLSWGA